MLEHVGNRSAFKVYLIDLLARFGVEDDDGNTPASPHAALNVARTVARHDDWPCIELGAKPALPSSTPDSAT
jgi:hypothetical protein